MEKRKLVIVGAGGFGREVLFQILDSNIESNKYDILGFVDDTLELQGKIINGYPIIGTIDWLVEHNSEICAVICIGNSQARRKVVERISENTNVDFPSIIASDVKMSEYVELGKGCVICLSNILTTNIKIGDFVIINLDCTVGHDAVIEDFVTIYPSVNVSGNVYIESCAEIGTGSNIIQAKRIGKNTIIGAGSVVIKDVVSNCIAVGAPAVPIKFN